MSDAPGVRWPAAVLWDMDGTLVDTEPYWIEAECELAAEYGAQWSEAQALHLVGFNLIDSGRYIQAEMGLDLSPEQIVERLLDGVVARVERKVPWRPGALELLADLRAHEVPCGLVTMSYLRFVEPVVRRLPAGTFATVITGDAVDNGKPHPEPYLVAAARLGVEPGDCVAIEDSDPGATSAAAAGCLVLVVPNHVVVPAGERRVFASSLSALSSESLAGLRA